MDYSNQIDLQLKYLNFIMQKNYQLFSAIWLKRGSLAGRRNELERCMTEESLEKRFYSVINWKLMLT